MLTLPKQTGHSGHCSSHRTTLSFPSQMPFFPIITYRLCEAKFVNKLTTVWKPRLWETTGIGIAYHEFFRILSRKHVFIFSVCKYNYFLPFVCAASISKPCIPAIWSASVRGNEVLKASRMEIIKLLLTSKVLPSSNQRRNLQSKQRISDSWRRA